MRILTLISRIFIGLLFTFSGFVKAVDPLGSAYKFTDYFTAFGTSWAAPLSFFLAIILSTVEFAVGLCLLFNVRTRLTSWGALLFMAVFTPLTLYLAIANPVHDCGCFGDFLIITNWQTFWKNIFISAFVIILFINRKKIKSFFTIKTEWLIASAIILLIIGFQFFCLKYYISSFDFRPYTIGTHIPDKMKIPTDAPKDQYITYLYYKKDGVDKEFTQDNYPWQDTTWVWTDTKNVLVKKGYTPPIHDFTISTIVNESDTIKSADITDAVLNDSKNSYLFIAYDLRATNLDAFKKIKPFIDYCKKNEFNFYCLTSTEPSYIKTFLNQLGFEIPLYKTDAITLKTIIRSNPGLLRLKKGTITGKWHYSDIPEIEKLIK